MPKEITGSTSNFSATADVPSGGDARNSASVETPFQRLLDNEAYLNDQALLLGPKTVRTVTSVTALKAINTTGVEDGEIRVVGGTENKGIYRYHDDRSDTEALPWLVTPTTGPGRWIHELYSLFVEADLVGSLKIPTLDSSNRLRQNSQNQILQAVQAPMTGIFTTSSTTYVDVPELTQALATTGAISDRLHIDMHGLVSPITQSGDMRIVVTEGATVRTFGYLTAVIPVLDDTRHWHLSGIITVLSAAALTVKVQVKTASGGDISINVPGNLSVLHIRP